MTVPPCRKPWRHRIAAVAFGLLLVTALASLAHAQDARPANEAPAGPPAATLDASVAHAGVVAAVPERKPARSGPALQPDGPPANLRDLAAWLDYKVRHHVASLPHEARIFYRRGLLAEQSHQHEEAVRLVRGASELDPSFAAPHFSLASWFLVREPSQMLLQYAAALELLRHDFALQLELAAEAFLIGLEALFLGLLAAGVIIVFLRHRELRHGWCERLGHFLTPGSARLWSWGFLLLPFTVGLGLALPTVAFLGMLWSTLRVRERVLFILLAGAVGTAPLLGGVIGRMSLPLREDAAPFFGVALIENEPYSRARQERLAALALTHPGDPFVQFGLGWTARHGGDLATAEEAYRHALVAWPDDGRVLNNLGNTLTMQGRLDEALACYQKAVAADPGNAPAHFNASQIYTQRFEYRNATRELSRASAIDFELVKSYQSLATADGWMPLVDQWIEPHTFWTALWNSGVPQAGGAGSLPPAWRPLIECSGWRFSALALLVGLLSVLWGLKQNRSLPLRACSNCGQVVCRRCAERRREHALCPTCAALEARAESPDFARVLLQQHRRRVRTIEHLLRTALATVIPGYGLLAFRHVFRAVLLLAAAAVLLRGWLGFGSPFVVQPRLAPLGQELPLPVTVGLWVALYAVSLLGYFVQVTRTDAQAAAQGGLVRSRSAQVTHHVTPMAA